MKMQKLLVLAIVSMFILSIGASTYKPAYAATTFYAAPASIVWDTSSHSVGDTFHILFHIDNVVDMAGFQFDVLWNNAVLSTSAADCVKTQPFPGSPFEAAWTVDQATGKLNWVLASMAGSVAGSFMILDMKFTVIAAPPHAIGGTVGSAIDIANDILGDSSANNIVHTTTGSTFTFNYAVAAPPTITVGSKTINAPGTFDIPVTIASYDTVYAITAVHFVLTYNDAVLHATGAAAGTWGGTVTTAIIAGQITVNVAGVVPVGSSGTIALIHFDGYFDPGPGASATSALHLLVANFNGATLFSSMTDGIYTIAVPSAAVKALGINPPLAAVSDEGVIFTVDVLCYNITSVDKFFGAQYTFTYNPTQVVLLSVTEGPFFAMFPWQSPPTWFFFYPGVGHFTVAQGLLGGGSEPLGYVYPHTTTPSYSIADGGVLAHVTFKSLSGIPGATVSSPFTLSEVIFGDVNALEIPVGLIHNGMYSLTLDARYIDIFTQYPDPYGGQRRFFDSDAFTEQDLVCLFVYVTYNGWPVANKLVNFEIHGPANPIYNITLYYTAFTNSSGYAKVCFRIDWPSENPEDVVFGTWTVYGSVSLDQVTVFDVLHFQVGWLVNITKITTNEDAYRHGWHMTIDIYYTSISHQLRNTFFTATMTDDSNYGLGSLTFATIVGYGDGMIEVTCFQIPLWARSGVGTVHGDVFTAPPALGGRAYCPEYLKTFGILAA